MVGRTAIREWLDATGAFTFSRDFDGFRQRVALPFEVSTINGHSVIATEAALARTFGEWIEMVHGLGADEGLREIDAIDPVGPNRILCRYTTELRRAGVAVCPPYPGSVVLAAQNGGWRATAIWVGVENRSFPLTEPRTDRISDSGEAIARFTREKKT
ncbi:hypothetical protein [Palleronia sp. LCG004]|uniref:hypothetical protein n=1 Tax=Palleronia sp. LCG004 TaxID=3079304 RepID=UPI0029437EF2|nr:hypothetical protein [Palleronia sp. LCG004]WOI56605.1 hypothetical protein RVY76_02055 [Palleronia sp. LCG004]